MGTTFSSFSEKLTVRIPAFSSRLMLSFFTSNIARLTTPITRLEISVSSVLSKSSRLTANSESTSPFSFALDSIASTM